MHVGLNLLFLLPGTVGGTETYASGLVHALAALDPGLHLSVYLNEEAADWPLPQTANVRRVVCPVSARSRARRYAWEQLRLPALLTHAGSPDLLHSLGYVAPLRAPCPNVVTIHDLNYRAFGDSMPLARRLMLRVFVEQSARRADHVIAVSHFGKSELVSALGLSADRVTVTHQGPRRSSGDGSGARDASLRAARRRAELGLESPYVVAFSSSTPNKNLPRLLDAVRRARSTRAPDLQLVLVGHPPAGTAAGAALASGSGVRSTGYVDDDTLDAVLGGARMLAFPSLYEGFGLPVLEAMAAGVPVVCSTSASLPEVAGDAAEYFDPRSTHDMADALTRVWADAELRRSLQVRGFEQARRFTWDVAALRTLDVYRSLVGRASYSV